jgi:protease-4
VTASDSIFHALMQFKQERRIPLVAHFLDVAASGAYYIALAADEIIASPTSVTGSVGAVMYSVNLNGLMAKIGVANQTVKSGDKKDIGSPLREMTEEDSEILHSIIDGMRDRFVGLVQERRPAIYAAALQTIADGRIFSADQALRIGLVDRVGQLQDAIDVARRRARIAEARLVMYRRPREYSESIYSQAASAPVELNLLKLDSPFADGPSFLYMWAPRDAALR